MGGILRRKPFLPASRIPAQMLWLGTLPKLLSIEMRLGRRRSYSRRPSWPPAARLKAPTKVCPSRCRRTVALPSWGDLAPTTRISVGRLWSALLERLGCSRTATAFGRSKAINWSVPPANMEVAYGPKVRPSPCPPTATPLLWADLATTKQREQLGYSLATAVFGHSRATNSSVATRIG